MFKSRVDVERFDLDSSPFDTPEIRRTGWIITIILMLFMFVNFADKVVVGIVGIELQHDLGISAAQFGLLQSVFFWPFAVGALVLGALGGRINAKWLLTGLVAVWVISLIPLTGLFSVSFVVILAARLLLGFAEGPAGALSQQIAHTWFVPKRRSLPSSVVIMGASLGPLIAAPVLTWVMQHFGWQATFYVLIGIGILWVVLWLLYGKEGPAANAAATVGGGEGNAPASALPETARMPHLQLRRCRRLPENARVASAREALETALARGRSSAALRPFFDMKAEIRPLLNSFSGHFGDNNDFAENIRQRLETEKTTPRPILTPAELKTLRELASGDTTEAIAETLWVSVNTVKTHLRSIYRKLEVANRREALLVARTVGLL